MPDHWHDLVELGEGDDLSRRIQALKSNSACAVHHAGLIDGRIRVPGFHDRAAGVEDDPEDMARYLVLDPVRAGLVARAMEYSYWDAVWLRVDARGRGGCDRD
jgi:REP element-mobilizing transposase RayT